MLGLIKTNCGTWLAARSRSKSPKEPSDQRRVPLLDMLSYEMYGLDQPPKHIQSESFSSTRKKDITLFFLYLGGEGVILVFANVVPTSVPRAPLAAKPHEPGARLVLKVPSPAYPLGVEQVYYGGHILGYSDVLVVVEAKVVAPYRGDVVRLGGVRLGVVFRQEDALALEIDEVWVIDNFGEVLSVEFRRL